MIIGNFNDQPGVEHPASYFEARNIILDCRAPNSLFISNESGVSFHCHIVTLSHKPGEGFNGALVNRPVTIRRGAWIGAFATLYNCTIGEGAIVSIGSVVASRDVPPDTIVEGNPAKIIAVKRDGKWQYLDEPIELPRKK